MKSLIVLPVVAASGFLKLVGFTKKFNSKDPEFIKFVECRLLADNFALNKENDPRAPNLELRTKVATHARNENLIKELTRQIIKSPKPNTGTKEVGNLPAGCEGAEADKNTLFYQPATLRTAEEDEFVPDLMERAKELLHDRPTYDKSTYGDNHTKKIKAIKTLSQYVNEWNDYLELKLKDQYFINGQNWRLGRNGQNSLDKFTEEQVGKLINKSLFDLEDLDTFLFKARLDYLKKKNVRP
jgi:hypothetical protein